MELENNIIIDENVPKNTIAFFEKAKSNLTTCSYVKIREVSLGYVKASMKIEDDSKNPYGIVHGGMIFALADNCAGYTAATLGARTVTLNSTINFIGNAKNGTLYAEPVVIHNGGSTKIIEVNITDDDDRLIAKASFTMFKIGEIDDELDTNEEKNG